MDESLVNYVNNVQNEIDGNDTQKVRVYMKLLVTVIVSWWQVKAMEGKEPE